MIGRQVGGIAAIALGAFLLWWDDFAAPWEHVSVASPLKGVLAYVAGAVLVVAGAGLLWRRTARPAALVLAAISAVFAALWVVAAVPAPHTYDPWSNVAEQSSIAAGFLALFATLAPQKTANMARLALGARVWFGACSISFGVVHFVSFKSCVGFVPPWVPLGGYFWSVATGVAHLAAAIAILSGIWARLAARLATVMYLGFGVIAWGRGILAAIVMPKIAHFVWGGEVITFILAAAVWMIGNSIAAYPPKDGALFLPKRQG